MSTINVKYIGKKPFAIDNVARSGQSWDGPGSVRPVTPTQAKRLIAYADQWELENPDDLNIVAQPAVVETQGGDGEPVHVGEDELSGPLEKMTASQLVAFAKLKYAKTLRLNMGRTKLLNEVEDIVKNNDPVA